MTVLNIQQHKGIITHLYELQSIAYLTYSHACPSYKGEAYDNVVVVNKNKTKQN